LTSAAQTSFEAPLIPASDTTDIQQEPMANAILVVDDNRSTLSGYLEYLAHAGFNPIGVSNGADALALAWHDPPAAVITDITMPGMDGFALAKALSQDTRTRHVPVIGLTAHWHAEVRARAAEASMCTVLLKPCSPAHLMAELQRALAASTGPRGR
jgi:CheY-like chemotaxis protein